MNLNNMNDDFSDSGYMNRNFETNLDEIFENLNYFLTTEKKRIKTEKETLNKTIQNFLEFNSSEKRKITKEQINYFKNKRIAIDMITNNDDIIGTVTKLSEKEFLLWTRRILKRLCLHTAADLIHQSSFRGSRKTTTTARLLR